MISYLAPGRRSSYLVGYRPERPRIRVKGPASKFDAAQFFFGFISVTVVSWLDNFESDAVTSQRHRDE